MTTPTSISKDIKLVETSRYHIFWFCSSSPSHYLTPPNHCIWDARRWFEYSVFLPVYRAPRKVSTRMEFTIVIVVVVVICLVNIRFIYIKISGSIDKEMLKSVNKKIICLFIKYSLPAAV